MSLPVLAFSGKFRTKIPQQDAGPSRHLMESSSHSVVRNMLGPSVPPHKEGQILAILLSRLALSHNVRAHLTASLPHS